ncbi:MAG TPA: glucoamylase family protein, partial [Agriterribacter sp.]|nr:glucoamylase family protein [Agriterribacter sp.]
YGYRLPLGPSLGGPLFFSQYSFLGINPNGLSDAYANYGTQTTNHSLINYAYCKANPRGRYGYSDSCWGLTASDIQDGYTASSPANDVGVIAPTAAISSLPYTPAESMKALKFFYYVLGDKLWKEYGFIDAFSLHDLWFANSFLAIDQGPQIVMIENYRSGLPWNLLMSCPEVKAGMTLLGFSGPG